MTQQSFYKQNLSLALPIMLSSMGQQLVQMVDTFMVGRLGTVQLAAISFASALTYNALVIGMGIALALTPLVGQNYAKNNKEAITNLFQNSLSLNTILAICLVSILLLLLPFLHLFGQPMEVVNECKSYYVIVALSFIPMLWFLTFKQLLEGIDNTKVAMIITISANILNIFLNWVFIYGKLGCPAMGVFGAGLSTFISRVLSPIAFLIFIYTSKKYKGYIRNFRIKRFSVYMHKCLLRIGIPIAGQMFIEFFSLFGITIMMGLVSTAALASYQIINTMISTSFLAASGICSATTVLVSHAYGCGNLNEIKKHFYTGWKMVLLIMGTVGIIFIAFGKYIAMCFSTDEEVIRIATSLFIVAGIFQLIDGTQVSGLAGLRGINDVAKPMLYAVIAYLFVALPCAYICGFVIKLPYWSIFAGFMFGLITAGILYHTRFHKTLKKHFNNNHSQVVNK